MLTYGLPLPGKTLSQSLYECIRADITGGKLGPGEKMPSKRALSEHLQVSKNTVENAYYQLVAEGYLRPEAKRGYYVEQVEQLPGLRGPASAEPLPVPTPPPAPGLISISRRTVGQQLFPFSVWARLGRRVLTERQESILEPVPFQGVPLLRRAISHYLAQTRGISADPEQIVIGAGSEYLYGLLVRFFGTGVRYGVEDPGFPKIRKIYESNQAPCVPIPMDGRGVDVGALEARGVDVLHITPSHSYPSGQVTPMQRRHQLLAWAERGEGRYLIEDDYDCEFRFAGRPIPPLLSMDGGRRVIYLNTFSSSLAASIRISYMVLPRDLMEPFRSRLGFYSCPVGALDQYTLAAFIQDGHFERHIARTRKHCRRLRDEFLASLPREGQFRPEEKDGGLHFLLASGHPRRAVERALAEEGLAAAFLSDYYMETPPPGADRRLIVNCTALTPQVIGGAALAFRRLEE